MVTAYDRICGILLEAGWVSLPPNFGPVQCAGPLLATARIFDLTEGDADTRLRDACHPHLDA